MFINYAHRGASKYFPENTLSAFYAGIDMGANGIELDVQRTKDGVLVIFHDDTLERTTNGTGNLHDFTYKELLELNVYNRDFNRVDKIASFADFLKYFGFRDMTFAIELKQYGVVSEVIDMIEEHGIGNETIFTSFHYDNIKKAKEHRPDYHVGFLYDSDEVDPIGKLKAIGGEELCPKAAILDEEILHNYRSHGYSVRPWGIYNEDIMKKMYSLGVDGMTVNFPDKLSLLINPPNK